MTLHRRPRALILALFFHGIFICAASANVVGVDTQNFNPTNDGLDFVTVHSSKTLSPGLLNIGLFVNYAVNSLPNYENKTTQSRTNFRDSLLSSDVNFGLGLARNWEVGLSLPSLLAQNVKSDLDTYHGQFASTGATEFRTMTKLRLLGGSEGGIAFVFTINFNEIQNDPFLGVGAGPTYNFELVGDTPLGSSGFAWGLNAGYRLRSPGAPIAGVPIQPFGNQYLASTALSYLVSSWDTKIIAEVFSHFPAKSQEFISDRASSSAEALLGIKTDITRSIAFHFGGGSGIIRGVSSPDWRVYTGLNIVVGPMFSKPREVMVRVNDAPLKALETMETGDPFAGVPQVTESFIARDILFEFNSDELKDAARPLLQRLVAYVLKPPGFTSLVIEGHTDSVGGALYNLELSQRRANRVRATLVSMGLPGEKVRGIGYGASKPIASNGNYQGRALNRRVEFKVKRDAPVNTPAPTKNTTTTIAPKGAAPAGAAPPKSQKPRR